MIKLPNEEAFHSFHIPIRGVFYFMIEKHYLQTKKLYQKYIFLFHLPEI